MNAIEKYILDAIMGDFSLIADLIGERILLHGCRC